jgi:hypothetical protein
LRQQAKNVRFPVGHVGACDASALLHELRRIDLDRRRRPNRLHDAKVAEAVVVDNPKKQKKRLHGKELRVFFLMGPQWIEKNLKKERLCFLCLYVNGEPSYKMSAQCRPLESDGVHEFMCIALGEVLVFGENNVMQKPPRKRAKALCIRQCRQLPPHRRARQHTHEELQM